MNRMEQIRVVQEYPQNYSSSQCTLDSENQRSADVFAGAILYAVAVFTNRLILGGAYRTNKEDKLVIMDHLRAITEKLAEYEIPRDEDL